MPASEAELVKQAVMGNTRALTALLERVGPEVRRRIAPTIPSRWRPMVSLEDLMQETYMKIMASAHLYKPMGKPLAWMFTIAKNLFLSKIRKDKREVNMDTVEIEDDMRFSYVTDSDDKMILEMALDILTEEERQIVLLHAVSGLKHKEIAESIGLKLSTTLSKYHRALKKIREHLTEGSERHER